VPDFARQTTQRLTGAIVLSELRRGVANFEDWNAIWRPKWRLDGRAPGCEAGGGVRKRSRSKVTRVV
jgi:hypothetical protein